MNQPKLIAKWTALVLLNAIISYVYALSEFASPLEQLGMALGVLSWLIIYLQLDSYLLRHGYERLSRSLWIGALVKAFTQLYPMLELLCGILAVSAVEELALQEQPLLATYLITMLDGLLLSLVVGAITAVTFGLVSWTQSTPKEERYEWVD